MFNPQRNKKLLVAFLLFVCCSLYIFTSPYKISNIFLYFYNKDSIKCYRFKGESLPDISEVQPRKGKSIFFHETSCNSYLNDKIVITSRQACAVESAAKLHPNLDIYLLFTSPGTFKFQATESDRFIQALLSYDNVKINHLDYETYTKGTPLEELYSGGRIERSTYALSHASDVLRYLTLWKYGGTYLDLDVVVIKNLEDLPPNYAGCESKSDVAAGILNLQANGTGHALAEDCVMYLKDNFSGSAWGANGPGVITKMAKKRCGVKTIAKLIEKKCDGFKIYPSNTFYPVHYGSWKKYFEAKYIAEMNNLTKNSYIIHVWNKYSYDTKIPIKSKVPYSIFAKKYCPKVYEQCDNFF